MEAHDMKSFEQLMSVFMFDFPLEIELVVWEYRYFYPGFGYRLLL